MDGCYSCLIETARTGMQGNLDILNKLILVIKSDIQTSHRTSLRLRKSLFKCSNQRHSTRLKSLITERGAGFLEL